jgi:prepilin-type N-terminal cleavage/methylation domain-containing protein
MSRATQACRGGFTLVEVLVALVVATMLVVMAHRIFAAAVSGTAVLERGRLALDQTRNAHRFLTAAFLSVEVGIDDAGPFEGDPDEVRFTTWLQTPDGWFERSAADLRIDGGRLVVTIPSSNPVVLADGVAALHVDYLLERGADTPWVSQWHSPVSAPLAVRLRWTWRVWDGSIASDTALYLLKARG